MKNLFFALFFIPFVFACGLSNAELERQIWDSMEETLRKTSGLEDAEIVDFGLVHKGGNEYVGMLTLKQRNIFTNEMMEMTYDVDIIYDGENIQWKTQDFQWEIQD